MKEIVLLSVLSLKKKCSSNVSSVLFSSKKVVLKGSSSNYSHR